MLKGKGFLVSMLGLAASAGRSMANAAGFFGQAASHKQGNRYTPHQGFKEMARRKRQIEAGKLCPVYDMKGMYRVL